MAGWNEATLRSAASWKAFKDGKALLDSGAVSGVKCAEDSWSGTVREGKRMYKAAVKVISPTHLETRCGCPENQSTGALCAHGVATGLAAVVGSPGIVAVAAKPKEAVAPARAVGFSVSLPVNWRDALGRGRISATLTEAKEVCPADARISAWLAGAGQAVKFPMVLNPDPAQAEGFLSALAGHPRVAVGKTEESVTVGDGGRIGIGSVEKNGGKVVIRGGEGLVRFGESWWRISEAELTKLGQGRADAVLGGVLGKIAGGGVAEVGLETFLGKLGEWQEWLEFPEKGWLGAVHFVPAAAVVSLGIDGGLQRLEAVLGVRYGESESVVPGLGEVSGLPRLAGDRCEVRDLEAERVAVGRLERAGFRPVDVGRGKWSLEGERAVLDFLAKDFGGLRAEWKVTEGERFRAARKQVAFVEPKIEILGSGDDWLSFNLTFQSNDGSVIPAVEIRRLLAAGNSGSGKKMVISNEASNLIEPLFEDLELRQENGRFVASKRAGEVILEISKKFNQSSDSKYLIRYSEIDSDGLVNAVLRPYQTNGIRWLVDRGVRFGGGLLADDMGLGKTIQAIASIEYLMRISEPGTVLVVATASLLGSWKSEFGKFAPGRKVRVLHGAGREREQQEVKPGEVVLTTFGTLPRDLAWYLKQKFKAVVVDEASLMRNPDTDHAKAIARLDAEVRIALTGTPIENGVRDLWSIFRFVQPGWLGRREDFRERYELAAEDPRVMERLRLKVSPFMLRRTKEEVAPDLPSKIYIEEFCDLSPEQLAVYRDLTVEGRKRVEAKRDSGNQGAARMQVLTALLRLRQACCDLALLGNERFNQFSVPRRSAKLERLLELISEAVSGDHKILVFSQFQTQLREIEKCLNKAEIGCLRLDGQTTNRQELVDRFQSEGGPPVFLISLKAGGYGLNLTAADIVVHFDPWWNPAAEAQATDRAHRIGQTRPVTVYRLITRGTVEEKVVALQNKKRKLASVIDEGGGGDAAGWSEEELMGLMEG